MHTDVQHRKALKAQWQSVSYLSSFFRIFFPVLIINVLKNAIYAKKYFGAEN